MSVVATRILKDEIVIAADSITVHGYTQSKDAAKLFKAENGVIVGGVGLAAETALLQLFLANHAPKAATSDALIEFFSEFEDWIKKKTGNNSYKLDSVFHIVCGGRAFYCNGYYIKEITDYHAIGAGMDYALAALYLGSDVRKAVETACELSIYCERPIRVLKTKRAGRRASR